MSRRHESPIKRTNPGGTVKWVARYTDRTGKRRVAKPAWNRGKGTFDLRRDAQRAIDEAYERERTGASKPDTVGAYAETWTQRYPRGERTNVTNRGRIRAVLDVELEGVPLRDWQFEDVRRRHAIELVDVMLRVQGRAAAGAQNIVRTLSAMAEDAITDELTDLNPFRGVKVRANDPRVAKPPKPIEVLSWAEMHAFAAAAGRVRVGKDKPLLMDEWRAVNAEAMIRVLSDCGLRLGELLGLERRDLSGDMLQIRGTAYKGVFQAGDQQTKRHVREVPVSGPLAALLRDVPRRIDTPLLFPTPRGRMWTDDNFYRDVWEPARKATGFTAAPHAFRHSWVSLLRGAGVDPADLAAMAGHSVETATSRYTHALGRSKEIVQNAIGG